MTDETMDRRLMRVELMGVELREKLERYSKKTDAIANELTNINRALSQIKWIGLGVLVGVLLSAGDQLPLIAKLITGAL